MVRPAATPGCRRTEPTAQREAEHQLAARDNPGVHNSDIYSQENQIMAITLQKGGNVNLSKEAPGLSKMMVGLGWDVRATDGAAFDLDGVVFMVNQSAKVRSDNDFIFYNNLKSSDGSVTHSGDNRTGAGDGDDETVTIDLTRVPADVDRIVVAVTIHDADARRQNFGMIGKAFIRCVNAANNGEIARYDLSEDSSTETAMVFGEVYRNGADWKFRAIGQGFAGGLAPLARNYGVNV
jgi:tellurium resistance protein TerD